MRRCVLENLDDELGRSVHSPPVAAQARSLDGGRDVDGAQAAVEPNIVRLADRIVLVPYEAAYLFAELPGRGE